MLLLLLLSLWLMKRGDTCGRLFAMLTFHGRGTLKPTSGFRHVCHRLEGGNGPGRAGRASELESAPRGTSSSPTASRLLAPPPTDPTCYKLTHLAENRLLRAKGWRRGIQDLFFVIGWYCPFSLDKDLCNCIAHRVEISSSALSLGLTCILKDNGHLKIHK